MRHPWCRAYRACRATRGGMMEDRVQSEDSDLAISNCTADIESGKLQGHELAGVYYNRGIAYADLGEHRRAIEDCDQALRIDTC